MKLSIDDIKKIALGAEEVVSVNNGYEFLRFNKEEREVYSSSNLEMRTHSPAGVQLLFKTDGDRISIKLEAELCLDRSFFSLDILEDGCLIGSVKNFDDEKMTGFYSWENYPIGSFEAAAKLKDGEKEIRLVLPWSVRTVINEISIDNASYITPVKKEKTILMYGDSITHGYDSFHPSNAYSVKLAHSLGCELFLKAIGGEKFLPPLAKVKSSHNPDYVTIAYGTNDWSSKPKDEFDKNSEEFIKTIRSNYPQSKIFVITPIWRKDYTEVKTDFEDIFYIRKKLSEICDGIDNAFCVDGWELVPHEEEYYGDLRLHPNDDGFDCYCKNLLNQIKRYI